MREPSLGLPRNARLVLVLSDGQRTLKELMSLVKGATADDIALLLHKGLIDDSDAAVLDRGALPKHAPVDSSQPVSSEISANAESADPRLCAVNR